MSDRHAEHDWQLQALQGRESQRWQHPAPRRYRAPPTGRAPLRIVLAVLAISLVAAGVALVWHAGPVNIMECFK